MVNEGYYRLIANTAVADIAIDEPIDVNTITEYTKRGLMLQKKPL